MVRKFLDFRVVMPSHIEYSEVLEKKNGLEKYGKKYNFTHKGNVIKTIR